jgi:DNA-binding CsgD family transcriptional regulator
VAKLRTEQIYEGLFDDEAFADLPRLLAQTACARSGMLHWRHLDGGYEVFNFSYLSEELMRQAPEFLPIDPWTIAAMERPNRVLQLDQYVSARQFGNSVVYNDYIRASGDDTFHCLASIIASGWGTGTLSVHRGRSQAAFDGADLARFGASLDHFKKVLRVRGELSAAHRSADLARSALDGVALCMITAGADGRVLQANAAAETVLARGDGLAVRGGRLTAASRGAQSRLGEALACATAAAGPEVASVLIERDQAAPYLLTCAPIVGGRGAAIVLFRDPDHVDPSMAERLTSLFRLTPSEAHLAVSVAEGRTLEEVAEAGAKSINTVRVQLRSILAKTGASRQSDLVRLVMSLAQVQRREEP